MISQVTRYCEREKARVKHGEKAWNMKLLKEPTAFVTTMCRRRFRKDLLAKYLCVKRIEECCKHVYCGSEEKTDGLFTTYLERCWVFAHFSYGEEKLFSIQ